MAVFAEEEGRSAIGNVIPLNARLPFRLPLEEFWEDSGTFSISVTFFRRRKGLHNILVVSSIDAVDLKMWAQMIIVE